MSAATQPGSVTLTLFHPTTQRRRDVATFTWRTGATLEFLTESLRRHSRSLVSSRASSEAVTDPSGNSLDETRIRLVNVNDKTSAVDIREVLAGRIKAIGVVYDPSKEEDGCLFSDGRTTTGNRETTVALRDAFAELERSAGMPRIARHPASPQAFSNRSQHRYMELMSANKTLNSKRLQEGVPKLTWSEVGKHNRQEDCWVVLSDQVYDVTAYLNYHPGGRHILGALAGKDITPSFNKYHPWVNAPMILKHNHVGCVDRNAGLSHLTVPQSRSRGVGGGLSESKSTGNMDGHRFVTIPEYPCPEDDDAFEDCAEGPTPQSS